METLTKNFNELNNKGGYKQKQQINYRHSDTSSFS